MTDSSTTDITVVILREIRDKIDGTNHRLDKLNSEVHGLKGEVHQLTDKVHELTDKVDMTNSRLELVEHTVRDAAAQVRTVGAIVANKHQKELESLRKRVTRLEAKTSGGGT